MTETFRERMTRIALERREKDQKETEKGKRDLFLRAVELAAGMGHGSVLLADLEVEDVAKLAEEYGLDHQGMRVTWDPDAP